MAGHSNTVVTQRHYLGVTPGKIIREMQKVFPDMQKPDEDQEDKAA